MIVGSGSRDSLRLRRRRGWLVVVAALLLGPVYQQSTQWLDNYRYSPPGKLIAVHGTNMHLHCTGSGSPTVVLEAGATGFAQSWAWVQEELATISRVCSYDRLGLGWSEGQGTAHTGAEVARSLKALLRQAREPGPYVMVGHSMGGPLVQIFAGLYPDEVAGMGLVDPSHPDQLNRHASQARQLMDDLTRKLRLASFLSYTGIVRISNVMAAKASGLPANAYRSAKLFAASPGHLRASHRELANWDTTMASARRFMAVEDRPLTVISATKARSDFPQPFVEAFVQLHSELAQMSPQGRHVKISTADHFSVLTDRENALQTAEALKELVRRTRR